MWPFFPKYMTQIGGQSEAMYGVIMSGLSLVMAVTSIPAGMFADRVGERWGIALSGVLMGLSLAMIALWPITWVLIAASALLGLGIALGSPALSSLLSKSVPKGSLGMTYGLFWSALSLLAIPAPYIGGLLWEGIGPQMPIWAAVLVASLTVPVALLFLRRPAQPVPVGVAAHADMGEEIAPELPAAR
jgi:MFS family permease